MARFKQLRPALMEMHEMEAEHEYLSKRLYRLEKLQRMGLEVQPDLQAVLEREDVLDIAIRERRRGMDTTPG